MNCRYSYEVNDDPPGSLMPHPNEQPNGFGDGDPPHDAPTLPESGALAAARAASAALASVAPELEPDAPPGPAPELVPGSSAEPVPELDPAPDSEPPPEPEPPGRAAVDLGSGGFDAHPRASHGAPASRREKCTLAIVPAPAGPNHTLRLRLIPYRVAPAV